MNDIWETKDGRRRVRRDPPTIEEAVVAAQGLTDDLKEQMEIVASLMEITPDEARGVVLRMGQRKDVNRVTVTGRIGAPRAVVVERRTPRDNRATPLDRALSRGSRGESYNQRREPGSWITPRDTSRCQTNSTTTAPTTAPMMPAP